MKWRILLNIGLNELQKQNPWSPNFWFGYTEFHFSKNLKPAHLSKHAPVTIPSVLRKQPWPPGSPGTSHTTEAPSGIRPTWWPTRWCWSWAGSWRRRRGSRGSGRTSIAASRPAWTTAGWPTRPAPPTPLAPARSWAWRTCAPRCRPPAAARSYSSKRA